MWQQSILKGEQSDKEDINNMKELCPKLATRMRVFFTERNIVYNRGIMVFYMMYKMFTL